MSGHIQEVRDEYGTKHRIKRDKPLAPPGGQGTVYRTMRPGIIVKLRNLDKYPPEEREQAKKDIIEELRNVMRLPIPPGCHLAAPLALLTKECGYTMLLLDDMQGISSLLYGAAEWPVVCKQYAESGGLRRRLYIMGKAAAILAQLHGAGLVYCDISLNNIFASTSPLFNEVWIIDADNLCFQSLTDERNGLATPGFGAPEIFTGSPNSSASDVYSFAVAAFYILSLSHPFTGALDESEEENDEEDHWDNTPLSQPPYIYDPLDDSNHAIYGFPPSFIFTKELSALFEKTFSAEARQNPLLRPSIFHWPKALFKAGDVTLRCRRCGMSWQYYEGDTECPFCEAPVEAVLEARSWIVSGTTKDNVKNSDGKTAEAILSYCKTHRPFWQFIREFPDDKTIGIPGRVMHRFLLGGGYDEAMVHLTCKGNRLTLRFAHIAGYSDFKVFYSQSTGFKQLDLEQSTTIPGEDNPLVFALFSKDEPDLCRITRVTVGGKK